MLQNKKVCIILNGQIQNYQKIKQKILNKNYDYIICCDGGANHAFNMNITPDYIVGDLDSINSEALEFFENQKVEFKKFKVKKDETDSELAILFSKSLNAKKIDIYGSLGGRVDHQMANINLLYYAKSLNVNPKIISENEIIGIIKNEEIFFKNQKGKTFSIIPIKDDAKKVSLSGFEYNLDNFDIKFSSPIGISNVLVKDICSVKVENGSLLYFLVDKI